jgi:copper homeostasis protein
MVWRSCTTVSRASLEDESPLATSLTTKHLVAHDSPTRRRGVGKDDASHRRCLGAGPDRTGSGLSRETLIAHTEVPILVEACVDSVESALAAERGGAERVELCDALFDGGTTPSAGMIAACKEALSIPVFVMIRPRGGGFVYTDAERDVMRRDVVAARELGAHGVVIGGLLPNGTIDVPLVRCLVEAARELPVTFHRAFDLTPDLEVALESLIGAGVRRVLTAGGASTAAEGAVALATLVRQAGSRLTVMAGGGVREDNVRELVSVSAVREVHVRLTRLTTGAEPPRRSLRVRRPLPEDESAWEETDEQRVRRFVMVVR